MNEVTADTARMVLDTLDARQLDAAVLWAGLPVERTRLRLSRARIDWDVWVEMMARIDAAVGPAAMEQLFVAGSGRRTAHPFVDLANVFLSVRDLYALFARWGVSRSLMVLRARFESEGGARARFTVSVDETRRGSLPTLRFIAGSLRHLPGLQGLPPASIQLVEGCTPHRATYAITLPRERTLLARARRVVRVVSGATAALDELERQADEIAAKNAALERQLAETARAAATVRERDEWLGLALDAGRVGIWRFDAATGRLRLSDGLGPLLGLPGQTDIDVMAWTASIYPEDQPHIAAIMRAALAVGGPIEAAYRAVRPSGELGWVQIKGRVVVDPAGGPSYAIGSAVDTTANKLVETHLRFADRLIAAGTLAAGVAHEINNPLSYVLSSLELVRRRIQDQPRLAALVDDDLSDMADGLARIREVVAGLGTFARPEADTVMRIAPRDVCTAALRIASASVRHNATVSTIYADDVPAVIGNPSRLGQVLVNLIVNASHAMPERPASRNRIEVHVHRLPTGEAAIAVRDNGTGIADDVLPRLFDPFFTTKPTGTGTGLGLAVCQGIVSSLQGRIDVTTQVGVGTTFTVVLPAAGEPAARPASTTAPPPVTTTTQRVLVIDDEPLVRRSISALLDAHGYAVTEAASGPDGLARTLTGEHDVVLCDLMMPELDGVALHAAVLAERPELVRRIVFISGGAVSDRARAFIRQAGLRLLPKPFTLELLLGEIARSTPRT